MDEADYLGMNVADHLERAADFAASNSPDQAQVHLGFAVVLSQLSSTWNRVLGERCSLTAQRVVDETREYNEDE